MSSFAIEASQGGDPRDIGERFSVASSSDSCRSVAQLIDELATALNG